MNARRKKFLSYYRPYWRLLLADMICALILSATALALPLCIRIITKDILEKPGPDALNQIFAMGALMLALIAVYTPVSYTHLSLQAQMKIQARVQPLIPLR